MFNVNTLTKLKIHFTILSYFCFLFMHSNKFNFLSMFLYHFTENYFLKLECTLFVNRIFILLPSVIPFVQIPNALIITES